MSHSIDKSQFGHFLRMLDPNAKWFTFQTLTDGEGKPAPDPLAKVFNLSRFTRPVLRLYEEGAGVWITVNDTAGKGRRSQDVKRIRAVWQEDDDGYEGDFPLEPSLVLESSPGHYHRYWLVADDWPADTQGRSDFAGVMACMVANYGSDNGAKDISRCLRMPGFQHRKDPDNPHMVRLVGGNRRRYTRAAILKAFPPPESSVIPRGNGHASVSGESHAELLRQVLTRENYHSALTALAWRQVGAGMPGGQVVEQLRGAMLSIPEEHRDQRWDARLAEIPKLVDSAVKKRSTDAEGSNVIPLQQPNRPERRAAQSVARRLVSTKLSAVAMRHIEWIWPGRIARGKHTTTAGESGIGKSTVLYWIAAAISKGGRSWPCGEGIVPKGSVVILSAEDGAEDTIKPRILAAEGDADKVYIITATKDDEGNISSFTLQHDLQALEKMIDEIGDVILVIIDPISSYLGDRVDGHSNTDIRRVVEPLHEMADRKKVAVLTNSHFSKAGAAAKSRASHRVIGSVAFIALPRVAFAVVVDPEDENRRLVLHLKNNIAKAAPGIAYRLEQRLAGYIGNDPQQKEPLFASVVEWESEHVTTTADQAIAQHEGKLRGEGVEDRASRASPDRDEAIAFLRAYLADGPKAAKAVNDAARAAGINMGKPLREARERLVDSSPTRDSDGVYAGFMWRLKPDTTTKGSEK